MIVCIEKTDQGTYAVWQDDNEASETPSKLETSTGGMMGDKATDMKGPSATMTGMSSPAAAQTDNSGMSMARAPQAEPMKQEASELKDALLLAGRMLMSAGSDKATDAFNSGVNDTRPRYE